MKKNSTRNLCTRLGLVLSLMVAPAILKAQEQKSKVIYTGIYNYSNRQIGFPMVGLVNIAEGHTNHSQVGLLNRATNQNGLQMGLVNHNSERFNGIGMGLVQLHEGNSNGIRSGLVNVMKQNSNGILLGLVNSTEGTQNGISSALVNHSNKNSRGVQFGLVNRTPKHEGVLFGLVNIADTLDGTSVGIVNIIKQGGFISINTNIHESGTGEIQFKSGLERFYGVLSYQRTFSGRGFDAWGFGVGSRLPVGNQLALNPEFLRHNLINTESRSHTRKFSGYMNLIIPVNRTVELLVGPDLNWMISDIESPDRDFGFFQQRDWLDRSPRFWVGAHAGVSFRIY